VTIGTTSLKEDAMNTGKKRTRANGEGTIFKNRNRWTVACYDIHGIRRTQSFKKKLEAETWLVEQVKARNRFKGTYVVNPKQTVEEYLNNWLPTQRHLIRPNSTRFYSSTIKNLIVPYIGSIPASQLSPAAIKDLLNTLADKGYGHGSIVGVLRTISKAYADGLQNHEQIHNPALGVKMLSIRPVISQAIPSEDLSKLYEVAKPSPYDFARLMIGAELGLRPSEITGLLWSDLFQTETGWSIKVERQVQRVKGKPLHFAPTKTKLRSSNPLTPRQLDILVSHKRHQALNKAKWVEDLGVLFPNSIGRLRDETLDKEWMKHLCDRAGVKRYTRYQLRKSCFTNFLKGADLGTTKAFSGHTSTKTLEDHYITPENSAVREASNRAELSLLKTQERYSKKIV
jgi:integrase